MAEFEITSVKNERMKRLIGLRERRRRDAEGVFVVEGERLYARALATGLEPLEVYTDGSKGELAPAGATVVDPTVLDRVSYRRSSEGLIAVFAQFGQEIEDVDLSGRPLIVIAESIEKPGNLGAMARTMAAVGADAMITIGHETDRFNPNALRASTGAIFSIPILHVDLDPLSRWLKDAEIPVVGLVPDAKRTIWEEDFTGPCAVMVGPEDAGITGPVSSLCDRTVAIPMRSSSVDSLNASVAIAVTLYEAARQRAESSHVKGL